MSGPYEDKDRRIVPRWRTSEKTKALGELASLHEPEGRPVRTDHLRRAVSEFDRAHTISTAAEIIGAAIVAGCAEMATSAAEFVLSQGPLASEATGQLARSVLGIPPEIPASEDRQESSRSEIARLRKSLRGAPRNSLGWIDLARTYTSIGQNEKAVAAIRRAIALAPDNRFVVRSAARFYLHRRHKGDLDLAHNVVLASAAAPYDPWLLAAEMSIAGLRNKDPELYRDSKEMLGAGKFGAMHLSELAGALATLELTSGSVRRARRLFRLALEKPTDNTIAQARWAKGLDPAINLEARHYNDPLSAEARAWHFYYEGKWSAALANFWTWHFDQPFSRRPCATGSFIAAEILDNHDEAIDLARSGLQANPDDPALLNNLAFSLIHVGRLSEAKDNLVRVRGQGVPVEDAIPLFATFGLFAFRCGYPDRGRQYYREAIDRARALGNEELAVLAELHLAHEEDLAGGPLADELMKAAHRNAEKLSAPYLKAAEVRLQAAVQQRLIEPPRGTASRMESSEIARVLPRLDLK